MSHATVKQIPAMVKMKSSRFFCCATRYMTHGTTQCADTIRITRMATTFMISNGRDEYDGPEVPIRSGVRRIIGMTARSWKMRIPRSVLPDTVSTSPRSWSTFMTMAVLESETRKPKNIASWILRPMNRCMNPAAAITVVQTWIVPPRTTTRHAPSSFSKENSRPMVKSSRMTPISPIVSIVDWSLTMESA